MNVSLCEVNIKCIYPAVFDDCITFFCNFMLQFCQTYHGKKLPVKEFEERHDLIGKKAIKKLNDLSKFRDNTDAQGSSLFSQLESRMKAKHDSLLLDIERRNEELALEFRRKVLTIVGTVAATAVSVLAVFARK